MNLDVTGTGFNPSFTGIALVAHCQICLHITGIRFQSFFYWNCLGGRQCAFNHPNQNIVSILLLLELPWWPILRACICPPNQCFNPSFTGIALVAVKLTVDSIRGVVVSILLLLELPWWREICSQSLKKSSCFNPSFTGIALVASRLWFSHVLFTLFQSFFYWNCLGGKVSDLY